MAEAYTHERVKFYYLKQHAGVDVNLWLRKNIEIEGPALVFLDLIIPMEGTYSELEGYELLAWIAEFLVSLFDCVVIMWFVF